MINNISISNVINSLVPISRFNKGEANKIFDEVKQSGYKIVVKNNIPACVLLTPEKFQEMLDAVEDSYLLSLAIKRMENVKESDFVSSDEVYGRHGITAEVLQNMEVEIE